MVRKSAMRVLVVMGLLVTGAGCSVLDGDSGDVPDLVVAATLELTGPNDDIGIAHRQALELQAEQINASGVLGDRRLRVMVQDNQSNPTVAVSQIAAFAGDPAVSAIVSGACSQCAADGAKVANDKKVPLISLAPASSVGVQAPAASPAASNAPAAANFVFKIGPNGSDNARTLVDEISAGWLPGQPKRKIGVLYPDDIYGADASNVVTNTVAIATSSVEVVGRLPFKADGSNLRDQARELVTDRSAATTPQAMLVWALPEQAGLAADALRTAGFKDSIFFDSAAAGGLFLTNPATEGATIVFPQTLAMDDVIATTPAKAARKQWFEDYTARYGAYHGQASFAADALILVATAVNRAGTTNRVPLRNVIESVEIDGLSGPLRLTPANHSALMPQALEVLVAKGGRWRLVG